MLRIAVLAAAVFVVAHAAPLRQNRSALVDEAFRLDKGRAGNAWIGQPIDDLYARFGRENTRLIDLFQEGMFDPALEVSLGSTSGKPALVISIREWPCFQFSVWAIRVNDSRFRTREGLGVGATLNDIRRSYNPEVTRGEGPHVAVVRDVGLTFELDDSAVSDDLWRVNAVYVVPQPEEVRATRCPQLGPFTRRGGG